MADKSIYGMKILFFGLETMGYEKKILEKMKELGAEVDYYSERAVTSQLGKAIVKSAPNLLNKRTEDYYHSIVEKHKGEKYDVIFIMKCDTPNEKVLSEIKNSFPKAKLRLHMWDSLVNIPNIEEKLDYFDRVTSFDREDCIKHPEFGFRPLFYLDQFALESSEKVIYDVSFCGTIHTDRYTILELIRKQCEEKDLRFYGYYYMQSKLAYFVQKLNDKRFRNIPIKSLKFETISSEEVRNLISSSRAVIDIQHPTQTGLTMRTIETLGARRKLITTNKDVVNYDFYNKNNICIIDRNNPYISEDVLMTPFQPIDNSIYQKYSLKQWVIDVLTM